MGLAVAGMHYTAMRASVFFPDLTAQPSAVVQSTTPMAVLITLISVLIAGICLVASIAGRKSELAAVLKIEALRRQVSAMKAKQAEARRKLFRTRTWRDQDVKVGGQFYRVVGVTEEKPIKSGGPVQVSNLNNLVYIPYSALMKDFGATSIKGQSGSWEAIGFSCSFSSRSRSFSIFNSESPLSIRRLSSATPMYPFGSLLSHSRNRCSAGPVSSDGTWPKTFRILAAVIWPPSRMFVHRHSHVPWAGSILTHSPWSRPTMCVSVESKSLLWNVSRSPVLEVLRTSWTRVLLAGGAFTVVNTTFYIYITFLQDYGVRILHMPRTTVLMAIAVVALVQIPALAWFASISDRIGRRKMYLAGSIGTAIWAFPLFWLVDTATGWGMTLGLLGGQITLSMMYGPLAAFFAELFNARLRYSGASLGYQLGALFGGAVSSLIATWLFTEFGSNVPISIYIILVSVVAISCTLTLTETYQHDLDDAEEAITTA